MGIAVEGARKRFGDFQALDDVSIDVPDGSLTALLGPSGSDSASCVSQATPCVSIAYCCESRM